jgi:hypothetical protein
VLEELADHRRFVGGETVEDDVNRLSRCTRGYDLLQEGDEFPTVMAGSGFAVDTTSGGIERRIQGECSVPVVLEAVTFGASRRERQGRDRDDPRLAWRSSRQCRTRPRVGAGADKGREYRSLCFRTRDRHWPDAVPGGAASGRLLAKPDARRLY